MQLYETTVIIDSALRAEDLKNLVERITSFISNNGGEVVRVEEWGKRRLAYEVKKKQYGYYLHLRFQAPPALTALLEKEYRLNESILRYLTIKIDARALKREERERQRKATAAAESERPAAETDGNSIEAPVLEEAREEV